MRADTLSKARHLSIKYVVKSNIKKDFKGDVSKPIGYLSSRIEEGFGEPKTQMTKNSGGLEAEIKTIVWLVRVPPGKASMVRLIHLFMICHRFGANIH